LISFFISNCYGELNPADIGLFPEPEGNIFQVHTVPEAKNSDSSRLVLHEEQVNGMFLKRRHFCTGTGQWKGKG
jgi:hypothetical protein